MKEIHFNMQSSKGLKLFCREWLPEQEVKAAILLIHGLGDHSGRFEHFAKYFTDNQIAVLSFDLPGHGKSEGKRGHIESYGAVMVDIQSLIFHAEEKHPGVPLFLYGHSMGGALALYFGFTQKALLTGLIVTSPGLSPASPVPPFKFALGKVLSRLIPSFALDNGLVISGISRDLDVVERYKKDPLVHPTISARLGIELIKNGEWIFSQSNSNSLPYPLLLMQGDQDRLVNSQINIEFGQKLQGPVTFKVWRGLYHELHNEPQQKEVFTYINQWLCDQLKK